VTLVLDGTEFDVQLHAFGRYTLRLDCEIGLVGLSQSEHLPAVRVQPRAEWIHSHGPDAVLEWVRDHLVVLVPDVLWSVSRLDLFLDVQGWAPNVAERDRFVCRSKKLDVFEDDGELDGIGFGRRKSGLSARIYNKTKQVRQKRLWYWYDLWGDAFDPALPVTRVEFEFGRKALKDFRVGPPEHVLVIVGELWAYATEQWLSLRTPTGDATRSRWPVAPEWQAIQAATLRDQAMPRERLREVACLAALDWLRPRLFGLIARLGARSGAESSDEALVALLLELETYENERKVTLEDRMAELRHEWRLQ
jgi:hypothetical protein